MADLRVGDPTLDATEIGPLATPQIIDEVLAQIGRAKAAGGRILTGGERISNIEGGSDGNYLQPTVIAGVLRTAPICQEEIFGPVALLFRIGSLEEAIALANDTPFGLASSAWTTDTAEQQRLSMELQCGNVFFNTTVASDPRLPFGGTKRSGFGRELSAVGMREFLNAKTVVVAGPARETQPSLFEQSKDLPKSEPRNDKPSEFMQIAEQMRKFEPRKPEPRKQEPEPREARNPTPTTANRPDDDDDPPPARGSVLGLR